MQVQSLGEPQSCGACTEWHRTMSNTKYHKEPEQEGNEEGGPQKEQRIGQKNILGRGQMAAPYGVHMDPLMVTQGAPNLLFQKYWPKECQFV